MNRTTTYVVFTLIYLCLSLVGCSNRTDKQSNDSIIYRPTYATGFAICCDEDSAAYLMVNNPWQGAESITMRHRINKPAERIVAMSSTFIAMLESLDELDRVVGVSGQKFITSKSLLEMGAKVSDVGYDVNVDFEKLVMLKPDIVLLYGVSGPNVIENKLKELNIPYIYIGDYLEESPLGKAEWVVAIGELIGKREQAVKLFEDIAERYNSLKKEFNSNKAKPKVMINAPYNDVWALPSTNNYMSQLIADAGGEYIYQKNDGNSPAYVDIEEAYMLMTEADIWINPGQASSKKQLASMTPRFTDTPPFCNNKIYNNNRISSAGGGNDFYESGIMNPDVILKDLTKVFYPDSFADYDFVYYQQLQ